MQVKNIINPKAHQQWLIERIRSLEETDSPVLASVANACLHYLTAEIGHSNLSDPITGAPLLKTAGYLKELEMYIHRLQRYSPNTEPCVKLVHECISHLKLQDKVCETENHSVPAKEVVSREEYETVKADRDSWKDAFGESNEKIAAEIRRREAVERENKRLRAIIVQHFPGDKLCSLCKHFERCKQEALEENDVATQAESLFWSCDGYQHFDINMDNVPEEGV